MKPTLRQRLVQILRDTLGTARLKRAHFPVPSDDRYGTPICFYCGAQYAALKETSCLG